MKKIKDICIYGIGGVGGFFGGKLANFFRSVSSEKINVHFIARGLHLEEIKKNGLILNTAEKKGIVCRPASASDSLNDIPDCDLYIICVKSYDLVSAAEALSGKVREDDCILPLLNGVDIYSRLRESICKGVIFPACVYVGTHIEKPGIVSQKGGEGRILFGSDPDRPEIIPEELFPVFDRAGILYQWYENPFIPIWEKFIFIASFGMVTTVSGKCFGEVFADNALSDYVKVIAGELKAIAGKKGVILPDDIVEKTFEKGRNFPYEARTSFQRDVEIPGKKNESDLFFDAPVKMAEETGIPVPVIKLFRQKFIERKKN